MMFSPSVNERADAKKTVNGAERQGAMASHSFHQLCFHFVWATKERLPLIEEGTKRQVIDAVGEACRKRGVNPIACNAMPDHMHLLVRLKPTIAPAEFIGEIKGATSYEHNHRFGARNFLKWQEGYGVVSLRADETEKVVRYIEEQEERHAAKRLSRLLETIESENE